MTACLLGRVLSDCEAAAGNCLAPYCGCVGGNCILCKGTGVADLPDPWGGVRGTCPDCHGTGNAPATPTIRSPEALSNSTDGGMK